MHFAFLANLVFIVSWLYFCIYTTKHTIIKKNKKNKKRMNTDILCACTRMSSVTLLERIQMYHSVECMLVFSYPLQSI